MKNIKLSTKAVVSLVLSAVLFCMPAVGFAMNENYSMEVHAENTTEHIEDTSEEKETEQQSTMEEDSTEEGTVSDGDAENPECTCKDKCSSYEYDKTCEVCAEDYKLCEYEKPNVTININKPDGWYNETATVTISVSDVAHTGNFELAKIQAKVGQNGSWTDVTEDKKLEISENCTVYVQVTDQNGNTYEKNRAIKCFDTTKPTLNAAVSDGLLSVQVHDTDSGAKVVYVNGYEFTELTNGTLNIRLQQFDAGYQYFTISAMDNAGNMSEVYKTANPYYKDPEDTSDENPAEQLPESAEATKPGSATGTVTEHTTTDSDGNTTSQVSQAEQKKQAMAEADASENAASETADNEEAEQGKEFYTIQTASDKVFYLIIDRDGEEEMVYFLTEVTENDLLNTTSDNSETLPKNSAALESAIPVSESALSNNNVEQNTETEEATEGTEESTENGEEQEVTGNTEANPMASYILMGGLAVAVIGGAYYFKVVRKKKEDFIEDEDEDEEEEEYENEDEESEDSSDDDFFEEQEEE
ncbi:MAG: DUF4366 domain-containing protein [Alphaproteobacteria bacterium]|nr:DUF4366 domain-containing protein [Alphaproteobacteria bacterium]MBQ9928543.1 DUF4366 domain-containing protein [Lachnospiraceae bacterium]